MEMKAREGGPAERIDMASMKRSKEAVFAAAEHIRRVADDIGVTIK